ncbi:15327_t:CDS:1, partial [Gigaspora margarita]
YFDKNNRLDSHVKSGGKKNDEPEGINTSLATITDDARVPLGLSTLDSSIQEQKDNRSNCVNSKTILSEPILLATSTNKISLGGAEGIGSQQDLAKPS